MRISFGRKSLSLFLPTFKAARPSHEYRDHPPERTLSVRIGSAVDLRACDLDFLFQYQIFPETILKFFGEWQLDGRQMRVGDVIVQESQLAAAFGLRLIFGVRILAVQRTSTRSGFTYGTLEGHPETGTNEFFFFTAGDSLFAEIRTAAEPASWIGRILAPVVFDPYIRFCNRQALKTMQESFLDHNPFVADVPLSTAGKKEQ